MRPGELTAVFQVIAGYRDGPVGVDGGYCALWVVPSSWRVVLPDGLSFDVANADPANPARLVSSGGFVTCRSQLGIAASAYVGWP